MPEIDFAAIQLLVLDVDGVLTDGRIVLTPAGGEIKSFNARDGAGMKYWKRAGGRIAIITGRSSPAVTRRAAELEVDALRLGAKAKLSAYREVLAELGLTGDQAAVMGDDLPDLPLMRHCALAAAPADADEMVLQAAHYVARRNGGDGCVRELIEWVLKKAGKWDAILQRYLPVEGEMP
jgi:3-deoxy-D-manno-octulosonate 8-phosphate phosphatase (KDO 8-P phosphatase)